LIAAFKLGCPISVEVVTVGTRFLVFCFFFVG